MNFDAAVIDAVTGHMNGDHPEDNLLIVRAFGHPEATESTMIGLDSSGGNWRIVDPSGEHEVRVDWPSGEIAERPEVRREIVLLYKAACEKLGVPAREEHAPEQAAQGEGHPHGGGHPHGAGHPHGGGHPHGEGHPHGGRPHVRAEDDGTFSSALRTATWADHGTSESSSVMEDIMRGKATRDDYVALVAQHYFMYEALEAAAQLLADDPSYAVFHPQALVRMDAIVEDLEFLLGADWREKISAEPATAAYAARMRELAAEKWLPGVLAHHYTRYLGDLSGGQMIAKRVGTQFGFDRLGIAFYDFEQLGPMGKFKSDYRDALDALGETLSDEEKARVIDEVRLAYRFNSDVFIDMEKNRTPQAA